MPPGGIQTRNPSKPETADLRLRPHGHWDRLGAFHRRRKPLCSGVTEHDTPAPRKSRTSRSSRCYLLLSQPVVTLMRSLSVISSRKPGFTPRAVHVASAVNKVAVKETYFSEKLQVRPLEVIPLKFRIPSTSEVIDNGLIS